MTDLATRPEVPLRIITPAAVRASIGRAKRSLEEAAEEIVWQVEMEGWRTLGYSSWNAMREAEYGDAAFMVPKKDRPELIHRMRAAGLTQQEIADTAGVSRPTVAADLNADSDIEKPRTVTNSRGQQRPTNYFRADSAPAGVDPLTGETADDFDPQTTNDPESVTPDPEPFGWDQTFRSLQELSKFLTKNPSPQQRDSLARFAEQLLRKVTR